MARDWEPGMARPKGKNNGVEGRRSRYRTSTEDGNINWDAVDGAILLATVAAVTQAGDAIVLARSSDGGVLSITVCSGQERVKFYAKDGLEGNRILTTICEQAGGSPDAL
jgi:hypothetical protein